MAKKRPPISFPELEGRGRGAILRSAEEIQAEEEQLQSNELDASPSPPKSRATRSVNNIQRSNERTPVATNERIKIRHTFDIFQDQLQALSEIQTARFRQTGRKPRIGDLAQEALDAYIKERGVSND
jgi:hypothetical protein